jgi:hypothetical protein
MICIYCHVVAEVDSRKRKIPEVIADAAEPAILLGFTRCL